MRWVNTFALLWGFLTCQINAGLNPIVFNFYRVLLNGIGIMLSNAGKKLLAAEKEGIELMIQEQNILMELKKIQKALGKNQKDVEKVTKVLFAEHKKNAMMVIKSIQKVAKGKMVKPRKGKAKKGKGRKGKGRK